MVDAYFMANGMSPVTGYAADSGHSDSYNGKCDDDEEENSE